MIPHSGEREKNPVSGALFLLLLFAAIASAQEPHHRSSSRPLNPREDLHGVLSRTRLRPPLRGTFRVRYSPDGHYLLVQSVSGIYLLGRDPLRFIDYVEGQNVYPAQFSPDSQSVLVLNYGLVLTRLNAADGKRIERKELPIRASVQTELSPDGSTVAWLDPGFTVAVYDLLANQVAYSMSVSDYRAHASAFVVPLGIDSAFSSPFGYILSNTFDRLANQGHKAINMFFSPDAKTLFVGGARDAFQIDLAARKKSSLPGSIQKHFPTSCYLSSDRLLTFDPDHENAPAILSIRSGQVLATPAFQAEGATLATDPQYALLARGDSPAAAIYDLEANKELAIPPNLGADIRGGELALLNNNGDLYFHRVGEVLPIATIQLPVDRIAPLKSAAVNADLTYFALAVDGHGASFRLSDGRRLSTLPRFSAANFPGPSDLYLLHPPHVELAPEVTRQELPNGKNAPVWSGNKKQSLRSGGAALIEYSFHSPVGRNVIMMIHQDGLAFRLRGLDPTSGGELWSRVFDLDPPIPFSDPQGERLVIGWKAKSAAAESAAHKDAALWDQFKHAKLSKQDTLFEVLDVRTGKPLAAELVQTGSGAVGFDSAFATGDALILMKDGLRVWLYSLTDKLLKARLVGEIPAATAKTNLLALSEASGRLTLYDLRSAEKLDEMLFADPLAYLHFSEDGQRLFVLTQYQEAFVLDVSDIRKKTPPPESH